MSAFKGILFDLDGTLAKTMEDHFKAWHEILKEFNIEIKPEDYYPLEGMRLSEIAKKLFEVYSFSPENPDDIARRKETYYLNNYKFEFYPGVEAFIDFLKSKNVPVGVVTAGLSGRVYNSVPQEFLNKFDAVVTGDQTIQGKPFPDPYIKGAEKLGLKPEECIVIENAPLGIKAAKSAGMYCIAVCTTLGKEYLEEADEIAAKFEDLYELEIIKKL